MTHEHLPRRCADLLRHVKRKVCVVCTSFGCKRIPWDDEIKSTDVRTGSIIIFHLSTVSYENPSSSNCVMLLFLVRLQNLKWVNG